MSFSVRAWLHAFTTILAFSGTSRGVPTKLGEVIESFSRNNEVQTHSSGNYFHAITQNKGFKRGEDMIVTSGSNGVYNVSILLDGHGGQEVVRHAGESLQKLLLERCVDNWFSAWSECIQACFTSVQDDIRRKDLRGGAAVIAFFVDVETMHAAFAWAGDVEAMVVRDSLAHFRSQRHDLENPGEDHRIRSHQPPYAYTMDDGYLCAPRGGCVMPTRGLGDVDIERAGFIHMPEVSAFMPLESDDTVVLASDGLWDIVESKTVIKHLQGKVSDSEMLGVVSQIAETAVKQWITTYGRASEADDVSVLIYKPALGHGRDPQEL